MAEAVVEDRTALTMRYFCHTCKVEINIPNANFTCPLCAGGFVEELITAQAGGSTAAAANVSPNPSTIIGLESLRQDLASLLSSRNGANVEITIGEDGNRHITIASRRSPPPAPSTLTGSGSGSGSAASNTATNNVAAVGSEPGTARTRGTTVGGGRVRPQSYDRLDNVLFDFLQSLTMGDDFPFGNSQFIFMGNPGDYAWGREGIDTIVTQLLNQMETSGPPPLSEAKIGEIPVSKVTEEEVNNKMQCSVCWEDFKVDESVRRLPCSHIYHESCIIPWLKLHNTCPICRKSLADETDTDQQSQAQAQQRATAGATIVTGPGTGTDLGGRIAVSRITRPPMRFFRANIPSSSGNNSSASTNTTTTTTAGASTSTTSQGDVFGFGDPNTDVDMDLD